MPMRTIHKSNCIVTKRIHDGNSETNKKLNETKSFYKIYQAHLAGWILRAQWFLKEMN